MKRVDGREWSVGGSLHITYCVCLVPLYRYIPTVEVASRRFLLFISLLFSLSCPLLMWGMWRGEVVFYASYISLFFVSQLL